MKKELKKRTSNRRYPIRTCKKPDCNEGFIPTDARQVYCSEQHRIDFNNDRRKLKELIDISFLKIVKKNRAVLHKIASSYFYKKNGFAHKSLLEYEGYDCNKYHQIIINQRTQNEVHICYDYGLELIDPINQNFSINNTLDYDL
ncbi:hypothetical protein [Flavobacterium sp. W22_SRS_FP1]|uniref:hypothetical protein n=1 Tax=Flavobacterium sp. W22_SRS_FP1 TaxID=3240276 RepID=UPI003F935577